MRLREELWAVRASQRAGGARAPGSEGLAVASRVAGQRQGPGQGQHSPHRAGRRCDNTWTNGLADSLQGSAALFSTGCRSTTFAARDSQGQYGPRSQAGRGARLYTITASRAGCVESPLSFSRLETEDLRSGREVNSSSERTSCPQDCHVCGGGVGGLAHRPPGAPWAAHSGGGCCCASGWRPSSTCTTSSAPGCAVVGPAA